jgi:hypothetical protein
MIFSSNPLDAIFFESIDSVKYSDCTFSIDIRHTNLNTDNLFSIDNL